MVVESKSKYNDGRWHTVEIARDRKIGQVKVIICVIKSVKMSLIVSFRSIKRWRDYCKAIPAQKTA